MPLMDGLTATSMIRQEEGSSGRHIRIIAMTAHAMKEDRERCLEHGMDGYVTKPFQPEALHAALVAEPRARAARGMPSGPGLRRDTPLVPLSAGLLAERPAAADQGLPSEPAAPLADAIDYPKLLAKVGGDVRSLHEIIDCFTEDAGPRLVELEVAVRERRRDVIARLAHALRGSAGNFSVGATYQACAALEGLAKNGSWEHIATVHAQLMGAKSGLLQSLASVRQHSA
jgi:CheY-like chemotaxis protein